jgi:hypothetical protein
MSSERKKILSLECSKCKAEYDVYEAARTMLCCNKPLCHQCVRSVTNSAKRGRYMCIICEKEADMPKSGFPLDTEIAEMLEQSIVAPLYEEENAELVQLKKTIINLENESLHGHDNIIEYFVEQRRLVQLAYEEIKKEIDENKENSRMDAIKKRINKRQEELMKELDETEKEHLRLFSENNDFFTNVKDKINLAKLYIEKCKEYLNKFIKTKNL